MFINLSKDLVFVMSFVEIVMGTSLKFGEADGKSGTEVYMYPEADDSNRFCYNDSESCGPSNWGGICNIGNEGRQSPIELFIDPNQALLDKFSSSSYKFQLSLGYKSFFPSFFLQNTGSTIKISLTEPFSKKLYISYDEEGKELYQFAQVHFHWGSNNGEGSEHRVRGSKPDVMEVHFVHWSLKYDSLEEAVEAAADPKSISVLGVFVEICKWKFIPSPFSEIIYYVKTAGKVPSEEPTEIHRPFSLWPFLPKTFRHFSYLGSLTTPRCNEVVKWTVMGDRICIHEHEIQEFRRIQAQDSSPLDINYRPLQNLGNRKIHVHDGGWAAWW